VSWEAFFDKNPTYWGAATPTIPSHSIYYCFKTACGGYYTPVSNPIKAQLAVVARARQVVAIGAEYTPYSSYTPAQPSYTTQPLKRGIYRCDTFVIDTYWYTAGFNAGKYVPADWYSRMDTLVYSVTRTPSGVWNYLRTLP
jgi:hypothetical protein